MRENGSPEPNPAKEATIPGSLVSPVEGGVTNWQPAAFNPETGLFYTHENNGFNILYLTDPDPRGSMGLGGKRASILGSIDSAFQAIDYRTGETVWRHLSRADLTMRDVPIEDMLSGRLADDLAGRIDPDRRIRIFNKACGDLLGRDPNEVLSANCMCGDVVDCHLDDGTKLSTTSLTPVRIWEISEGMEGMTGYSVAKVTGGESC